MAITLSTITGAAQTGFTSPTYTPTADQAPSVFTKQWYIGAIGGTQAGVTTHSISNPFITAVTRPASLATLPTPNPLTGVYPRIPKNLWKVVSVKGMPVSSTAPIQRGVMRTEISIPAGADTYSPAEIRALLSEHVGALSQIASSLGDSVIIGSI